MSSHQLMLEEIRELLKRIDQIVDSEVRRNEDQIDELKEKLSMFQDTEENLSSIHSQVKDITRELDAFKKKSRELKNKVDELSPLESKCTSLENQIEKLKLQQEGYIFTIKVISKWIPSQKENIDVLVALASSPNHQSTFKSLHKETTIPAVTLKNRVMPILADNSLVKIVGDKVTLTISELED
jgi:predicted nuclease with TOPRIM domain